ncbi:hypothetical protein IKF03_01055 [Candidatus Saccharibacteria bacterium]|nr:hypothetical protein [Candidatus Saccharibacteria bacterium]
MVKKLRRGFTLVEVGLFLGVTGMLFVGIVMGVQGSMFQQRYNDSVQGFADFLRTIYAQTSNVEGDKAAGGGRTEKAIYGKLVTFGEKLNLEGKTNSDNSIFSYTIVGNVKNENIDSNNVLEALKGVDANVIVKNGSRFDYAGIASQYAPRWSAKIQTIKAPPYVDFKGALLIVRHPSSGTVFTYVLDGETIEVNERKKNMTVLSNPLREKLDRFIISEVNFCVNPEPEKASSVRRNVRIAEGARNASGVEVPAQDDRSAGGNKCR